MVFERILVTGGAGFIGSHLVEALLAKGCKVCVLDNLSTGNVGNLPLDNGNLRLIVGDVADSAAVAQAMVDCQAVVHLAAVTSVQAAMDDPLATHQSNFVGTLNICEHMRLDGIQRVLFASSAVVYGCNGEGSAIPEDTSKSPLTPYAADKLASEHYLDFYRRQHGLEPVILRLFNIFGPRQAPSSYSGVISVFTARAMNQQPLVVFGDGEQTRDFVYVADLVSILIQALQADQPSPDPVNVGLGRSVSLNQVIGELGIATGSPLTVIHHAVRLGDMRHSRAHNARLLERFKLPAPTSIGDGLAHLIRSL